MPEEDRGRLQTLQEVIGFVFVAVEGALVNLRVDLEAAAYEATATSQLLTDIEAVRVPFGASFLPFTDFVYQVPVAQLGSRCCSHAKSSSSITCTHSCVRE